jgi:hypothetical protein
VRLFVQNQEKETETHRQTQEGTFGICKEVSWTSDDWRNVIWSDESKFNLLNSDGKEYHWTNRPEELTEDGITPTLKFGGGGIMVWSCLTWHGMKRNDFVSSFPHF